MGDCPTPHIRHPYTKLPALTAPVDRLLLPCWTTTWKAMPKRRPGIAKLKASAPSSDHAGRAVDEKRSSRLRNVVVGVIVFVVASVGLGPFLLNRYFDSVADNVSDQLGSVEVLSTPLDSDPLFIQSWAFADQAAFGPAPVSRPAVLAVLERNGIPVGGMHTQFVIKSNRANDLIVTEMRARVTRKFPPLSGTLLLPKGGGGPEDEPVVKARFNVGGPDPRAFDGRDPEQRLFADSKLRLSRGDTMILDVTGVAGQNCFCEWVIDIELAVGDQVRTVTVPDPKAPLRLTAPVERYASVYAMEAERATAVDPQAACKGDCLANPPLWESG